MVDYLREDGSLWTEADGRAMYGPLEIHRPDTTPLYHIKALHCRYDRLLNTVQAAVLAEQGRSKKAAPQATSALVVKVLDAQGHPKAGVPVVFSWPDAPADPSLGWSGRGVVGTTNPEGLVGFGMGSGAWYKAWAPPDDHGPIGPHSVWILGDGTSECFVGGGMLWCTNHYHVDVWFQEGAGDEPPPEDEPDPVHYYDSNGTSRDLAWAIDLFGPQDVHDPGLYPQYRLAELHQAIGDHRTLAVRVLDQAGQPLAGKSVVLAPRDVGGSTQTARTGADGYATFSVANDAYKFGPPEQGHWVVGLALAEGHSCYFNSAGWVRNVTPKRWLNPVFRYTPDEGEPPPDDPPPDDPPPAGWQAEAIAHLQAAIALIEENG